MRLWSRVPENIFSVVKYSSGFCAFAHCVIQGQSPPRQNLKISMPSQKFPPQVVENVNSPPPPKGKHYSVKCLFIRHNMRVSSILFLPHVSWILLHPIQILTIFRTWIWKESKLMLHSTMENFEYCTSQMPRNAFGRILLHFQFSNMSFHPSRIYKSHFMAKNSPPQAKK